MHKPEDQSDRPRGVSHDDVRNWFTYHPPTDDQQERYVELRESFRNLADEILMKTPACADQTAALRMLRECAMAVNQTIACNEDHRA